MRSNPNPDFGIFFLKPLSTSYYLRTRYIKGIQLTASRMVLGDRHRGQPDGCTPATPPGMRVRTGRFEKLRSCESENTYAVEVFHR